MKKLVSFLLSVVMITAMMSVAFVSVSAVTDDNAKTTEKSINSKSAVFEDLLDFGDNITDIWNYTSSSESDFITVTFCKVVNVGDDESHIFILDMNNKIVGIYTAETLSGTTICVHGNQIIVKAVTNITSSDDPTAIPCEVNVSNASACKFGVLGIDSDQSATISEIQKYLVNQLD